MAQSVQIKAVNHRHERLADIMISEPGLRLEEIAKRLNLTVPWLSAIRQSDAFKDYWALRSKSHSDALTLGIKEKAAALTELSLDILLEDVASKMDLGVMTANEARENLDLVTKRFGFNGSNGPQQPAAPVNLNFGLVTVESLTEARKKLRQMRDDE